MTINRFYSKTKLAAGAKERQTLYSVEMEQIPRSTERISSLKILRYRYFKNDKYVNLIQAQELDVNVQQGSLLFVNTKMCQ